MKPTCLLKLGPSEKTIDLATTDIAVDRDVNDVLGYVTLELVDKEKLRKV